MIPVGESRQRTGWSRGGGSPRADPGSGAARKRRVRIVARILSLPIALLLVACGGFALLANLALCSLLVALVACALRPRALRLATNAALHAHYLEALRGFVNP